MRSFDPLLWRMHAEAGVTTHTIARRARENGLCFPPDPGAPEQSQLGGTIATNAGGPHAFKYGVTGDWVTGLEVVLAPGELVRFGGPVRKDVAGYDLRALLCGSEGTLGIVTAAWLRLIPAPEAQLPVLATFPSTDAGLRGDPARARQRDRGGGARVRRRGAARSRLAAPAVSPAPDAERRARPPRRSAARLRARRPATASRSSRRPTAPRGGPGVAASSSRRCRRARRACHAPEDAAGIRALWRWRAGVSHAVSAARGAKLSEDIAVPLDRLQEGIEEILAIGARHGLEACSWGHAGDGNLHATFLLEPGDLAQRVRADEAAGELLHLALRLGGTVTGEHGIGVLKAGQLSRQWAPAAVAAQRAIKQALDPKGLLNPGKKQP